MYMFDTKWLERIEELEKDKLSGSKAIAINALSILKEFYCENISVDLDEISGFAELLKKAKPAMAAPVNVIDYVIQLLGNGFGEKSFGRILSLMSDSTIDTIDLTIKETGRFGSILTCSFSSSVIEYIKKVKVINPGLIVNALESEFENIKYGINLRDSLQCNGIDTILFPDNRIDEALNMADYVVLGADMVIEGKGAVNGTPSLLLAESAQSKKPVFVIAESFKKSAVLSVHPGFDFVPAEYITKIFTDDNFQFHPVNADFIINHFKLKPHPEGGYFSETYRSGEQIDKKALPARYGGNRDFSTCIYYLLKSGCKSKWHRLKSDETWHFYYGCSLDLKIIDEKGILTEHKLGCDFIHGEQPQIVVPRNCWMAARPAKAGSFSFAGCTVAPGFCEDDFEFAKIEDLIIQFPNLQNLINSMQV